MKKMSLRLIALVVSVSLLNLFSVTSYAEEVLDIPIMATEALVGDADTGEIIYNQNSLARVAPASTTKILTTLLVIEAIERGEIALDTEVTVTKSAIGSVPYDASHVNPRLKVGEKMNVFGLLLADMVSSDCHSCNILGELVAGSVPAFVELMNQRAAQLGCIDTHFVEPSGYPNDDHYTNAYSLFLITKEAYKHDLFRMLIAIPQTVLPETNLTGARAIENTNKLISASEYYNPYCLGGKTGTCNSAGRCLVAVGNKDGKNVISVVLGAQAVKTPDNTTVDMRYFESNRLLKLALGY